VDLFGDQTVQVAATAIEAAIVLLAALLLMLLSVHVAKSAIARPMLARVPQRTGRLVLPERFEMISDAGLQTSLPTRGPPGSFIHRRAQDPPGRPLSG